MTDSSLYNSNSMSQAAANMSAQAAAIKKDLTGLEGVLDQLWKVWDADSRREMQKTVEAWRREHREITKELAEMERLMRTSGSSVKQAENQARDAAAYHL